MTGPPSSWRGPGRRRRPPPDLAKAEREARSIVARALFFCALALSFCALAVIMPLLGALLAG